VSEIRSQSYPSDVVVSQDPAPKAAAGEVALLVNRAERGTSYVMPDLIGVNGDRAIDLLRGFGFRVAVVGSRTYPGLAPGIVLRQSPQAGFQIAPGEAISIEVSR
jgi:serine/threonine-protein kinase